MSLVPRLLVASKASADIPGTVGNGMAEEDTKKHTGQE